MALKLFYSPGSCALASHIALEESGVAFEPVRLDFSKTEQRSPDYLKINPKGRVPALADGDMVVTENPAILRYVSRLAPDKKLWPDDVRADARCAEWLAWISSGVHVAYAHIRRAERYATGDEAIKNVQAKGRETAREAWEAVEKKLNGGSWAAGDSYSVADPYLYVFWRWGGGPVLQYDMAKDFPKWDAHAKRMNERAAVKRALATEGLTA